MGRLILSVKPGISEYPAWVVKNQVDDMSSVSDSLENFRHRLFATLRTNHDTVVRMLA